VLIVLATGLLIAAPSTGLAHGRVQDFVADGGPVLLGLAATVAAYRVSSRAGVDPAVHHRTIRHQCPHRAPPFRAVRAAPYGLNHQRRMAREKVVSISRGS